MRTCTTCGSPIVVLVGDGRQCEDCRDLSPRRDNRPDTERTHSRPALLRRPDQSHMADRDPFV